MKKCPSAVIVAKPGPLRSSLHSLMSTISKVEDVVELNDTSTLFEICSETEPELVFLDGNLPNDKIWKSISQMVHHWPQINTIVFVDDKDQQKRAEELGANIVLRKGFPASKLTKTVENLLSG